MSTRVSIAVWFGLLQSHPMLQQAHRAGVCHWMHLAAVLVLDSAACFPFHFLCLPSFFPFHHQSFLRYLPLFDLSSAFLYISFFPTSHLHTFHYFIASVHHCNLSSCLSSRSFCFIVLLTYTARSHTAWVITWATGARQDPAEPVVPLAIHLGKVDGRRYHGLHHPTFSLPWTKHTQAFVLIVVHLRDNTLWLSRLPFFSCMHSIVVYSMYILRKCMLRVIALAAVMLCFNMAVFVLSWPTCQAAFEEAATFWHCVTENRSTLHTAQLS